MNEVFSNLQHPLSKEVLAHHTVYLTFFLVIVERGRIGDDGTVVWYKILKHQMAIIFYEGHNVMTDEGEYR